MIIVQKQKKKERIKIIEKHQNINYIRKSLLEIKKTIK